MYKEDLASNNPKWLVYHKTQPNQILYKEDLVLNNLLGLIYHKTQSNQILYIQYIFLLIGFGTK